MTTTTTLRDQIKNLRDQLNTTNDQIREAMKAGDTVAEQTARDLRDNLNAQLDTALDS